MSRYAGAGASTFAPACTHQQPPSRHPTPPAVAIHTSQGLRTSSCNTVGTTTTYGPPPYYVSHQHTKHPLSMSCVDLITLHQFSFKSALCRLRLLKCAMRRRDPAAAAAVAATPPLPTSPNPTTAPPTSTHQPTSTLPPTTPGMYKASAWVRAPGGSITLPPPPPPERVRAEGAYFALGGPS